MKKKQRNIVVSFFTTGILFVMLLLTTYAAFNYSQAGGKENKITSGTVSMNFVEGSTSGIQISNAYPILDEYGKNLAKQDKSKEQVVTTGYFDFTVSADVGGTGTIGYDVYLKNISTSPAIPDDYIKVYLTDSDTEIAYTGYTGIVPTFGSFSPVPNDATARIIYHDTFKTGKASKKFRLRLWVASTYGEDGTSATQSKNFKVKVGVKASQTV